MKLIRECDTLLPKNKEPGYGRTLWQQTSLKNKTKQKQWITKIPTRRGQEFPQIITQNLFQELFHITWKRYLGLQNVRSEKPTSHSFS